MKTNEELKAITAEGISEALTIPELTTIHNFHVPADKQVKKFRTKEQAIERCLKVLAVNVVVVPETAEPIEVTEQRCGAVILIDPNAVEVKETVPLTLEGGEKIEVEVLGPKAEEKTAVVESPIEQHPPTVPEEKKPRRKAVKGVAKIAMDLLRSGTDGENIISIVQRKYIDEGGYSEKDARANAQNILAYVKEKLQKEQTDKVTEDVAMREFHNQDAAPSAA